MWIYYDILFEFDRKHNFTSDKDVANFLKNYYPKNLIHRHMRIQGFLSERLSTIFFKHNFKRIKTFPIITLKKNLIATEDRSMKNETNNFIKINKFKNYFFLLMMEFAIFIIKFKLILHKNNNNKNSKRIK